MLIASSVAPRLVLIAGDVASLLRWEGSRLLWLLLLLVVFCVHFAGFVGDVDEGAVLHAGLDETHFGVCLGLGGGTCRRCCLADGRL